MVRKETNENKKSINEVCWCSDYAVLYYTCTYTDAHLQM